MARMQSGWRALGRRERTMVAAGGALLGAALLYVAGIEPAWTARARLLEELPRLQAQRAELEALREEARVLAQQGLAHESADSIRGEAQRSLARAGLPANLRGEGERGLIVVAASVQAQAWLEWMEAFSREARVRVVAADIARAAAPGMVQVEVTFAVPGR
jgi:general secretion pathway protein M